MTFILITIIRNSIRVILDNATPPQLASGITLGVLIGLTPGNGLYAIIIGSIIILFNTNIGAALLGLFIGNLVALFIAPLAHNIGLYLLTQHERSIAVLTYAHNTPIITWLSLNNTLQLGSIVIGIIAALPLYYLAVSGIRLSRQHIAPRLAKLRLIKAFKDSTVISWLLRLKRILRL